MAGSRGVRTQLRSLCDEAQQLIDPTTGRYLDAAIELHVVAQDLEHGVEAIAGAPPLVAVNAEPHRIGGRYDCIAGCFVDADWADIDPIVWYVGERQAGILLDEDPNTTRTLLYSAEGGGKTVLMAQWLIVQSLRLAERGERGWGGATAPTNKRLGSLIKAIAERVPISSPLRSKPGSWATHFNAQQELHFRFGVSLQMRATKKQSEATGSPIQGYTWKFSGDDELQDTIENGADPDIEARLRGARVSRRMCTATAKDSPNWRTARDEKDKSPHWKIERIAYNETPFIWAEHWERMRDVLTEREWRRRGLALDVAPERSTYHTFDRAQNLRPLPFGPGVYDVTSRVLGRGPRYTVLGGHDPGSLCDVSLLLRAFQLPGQRRHSWWVVDEITTEQTTSEQHVAAVMQRLRRKHQLNLPHRSGGIDPDSSLAFFRGDPYGDAETKPDIEIYKQFKLAGIDIAPAQYGSGRRASKPGRVPKESRIETVCSLLLNAKGERHLFIATDERGTPAAPRLVAALETSERDLYGKAETARKDKNDPSHWPAALGYALWAYEKARLNSAVTLNAA